MNFGFRKRRGPEGGASHPSARVATEAQTRRSLEWRSWRRSAQNVTRLWNEWLAADDPVRDECYRRYLSALVEEERAAASLERRVKLHVAAGGERDPIFLREDGRRVEALGDTRTQS